MKIHSDILTMDDLYRELPAGVSAYITPKGSRKRAHGFEVTLYVTERDALHSRLGNSGGYGASSDLAATWDEWGVWMDRLYAIDRNALIGWYPSYEGFLRETRRTRDYVRMWNKPHHVQYRTKTAPWLGD
jgi:hypothetical protein